MIIDQDEKFSKTVSGLDGTYPEDWKKHKIVYSKFNRSKQFGRTIPLPKPEVSLKKMIQVWMLKNKKVQK